MRRMIFADKVLILGTLFFAAYVYTFSVYNSETGEPSTLHDAPEIIEAFFIWMVTHVWIWLRIFDFCCHGFRFTAYIQKDEPSSVPAPVLADQPVYAKTDSPVRYPVVRQQASLPPPRFD